MLVRSTTGSTAGSGHSPHRWRPFKKNLRTAAHRNRITLAWTPDGRAVSFVNHENGVSNIWQQPVSGGSPTPVTHFKSGTIFNFQWSRDGRLALSRGSEMTDAVLIKNFR